MRRVYVQVVDSKTGIYQTGMIDEPVLENSEIPNALKHFGIICGEIEWYNKMVDGDLNIHLLSGNVIGTTKIVSVIAV